MSKPLINALVVRVLQETKGPLFFLRKPDGRFVFGWGAREREWDLSRVQEAKCWMGGKSFFAGFRIDPPSLKPTKVDIWKDFHESFYFVPRVWLEGDLRDGGFHYHDEDSTEAEDEAWQKFLEETKERSLKNQFADDTLDLSAVLSPLAEQEWNDLCQSGSAAIERGELRKFVPSRKKTFLADRKIDPGLVFEKLWRGMGSESHLFILRHNEDVFCGLSPEPLFSAITAGESFAVESAAIAGTRPRGTDAKEDARLAEELQSSKKEQFEHQVVVEFIEKRLNALGVIIEKSATHILKLKHLQHLRTPLKAKLKNFARVVSLLDSLHPTPAVGGDPQEAAMELLCKHELWERGYYAAPMGYVSAERGEAYFVVGLRSFLLQGDKAHFFAGAGYVQGSTAQNELEETRKKIESTLKTLQGGSV